MSMSTTMTPLTMSNKNVRGLHKLLFQSRVPHVKSLMTLSSKRWEWSSAIPSEWLGLNDWKHILFSYNSVIFITYDYQGVQIGEWSKKHMTRTSCKDQWNLQPFQWCGFPWQHIVLRDYAPSRINPGSKD